MTPPVIVPDPLDATCDCPALPMTSTTAPRTGPHELRDHASLTADERITVLERNIAALFVEGREHDRRIAGAEQAARSAADPRNWSPSFR